MVSVAIDRDKEIRKEYITLMITTRDWFKSWYLLMFFICCFNLSFQFLSVKENVIKNKLFIMYLFIKWMMQFFFNFGFISIDRIHVNSKINNDFVLWIKCQRGSLLQLSQIYHYVVGFFFFRDDAFYGFPGNPILHRVIDIGDIWYDINVDKGLQRRAGGR